MDISAYENLHSLIYTKGLLETLNIWKMYVY
jgi:hypothetical protein